MASVVLYCFRQKTLPLVRQYLKTHPNPAERSFGRCMEWLVHQVEFYGMKLPDHFDLIGDVGLTEYKK